MEDLGLFVSELIWLKNTQLTLSADSFGYDFYITFGHVNMIEFHICSSSFPNEGKCRNGL